MPHSSNVILTREALDEAVAYFMQQPAFAFDIESMGENRGVPTQNQVVWIALSTYGKHIVIPFGHPNGNILLKKATRKKNKVTNKFDPVPAVFSDPPEQLRPSEVFEALRPLFFSNKIKIAHNATFDAISVAKYFGEIPPGPYHDTIVIQWLLNENLLSKKLKDLIVRYYQVKYDFEDVGKCIEAHTFKKVAHYAYMDSKYTWFIWQDLFPLLQDAGLMEVFELERDLLPVLLEMGMEGAPVDEAALKELEEDLSERLIDIETRIYQAAGKRFNINSGPQKSEILFAPKKDGGQGIRAKILTKGGKKKRDDGLELTWGDYSTAADTLELYIDNPLVQALTEYAEVDKLLSTYVRGYLGDPSDPIKKPCRIFNGRVHADLVQYGTVTGRFSCREPNLQNIPRPDTELGNKIRGLFRAPKGYKFVVADYGQIEMVLLAHFAGPGPLWDGFMQGIDPHTMTAAQVFGCTPEEVTKDQRQAAKAINFAVVYGAGPEKVAAMAGVTVDEAKRFLEIHQKAFPEIYRFKDKVIRTCRERRPIPFIRTMSGRKRRLPTMYSDNYGIRGKAERQAVNSLIQGSAADLIKRAMIRLQETLEPEMRLILSVHDELVTLVPDHLADRCQEIVHEAMLGEGIAQLVKVPLSSDIKIVDRWSEAK